MKELSKEKMMTLREIKDALDVPYKTVWNAAKRLFPDKMKNGVTSYYNEEEVALISKELKNAHNSDLSSSGKVVMTKMEEQEIVLQAITILQNNIKELREQVQDLEGTVAKQHQLLLDAEPKVEYYDTILQAKGTCPIGNIAKDYGLSARALNTILHEERIQYKSGKQWLLYQNYSGKGYTKSKTVDLTKHDNTPLEFAMNTEWTQKGRLLIHDVLTKRGIKAEMDKEYDNFMIKNFN